MTCDKCVDLIERVLVKSISFISNFDIDIIYFPILRQIIEIIAIY